MERRHKRRVCMYYEEEGEDDECIKMVRDGLTGAEIKYTDIQRDATPGHPEISQMVKMMSYTIWTVLVFTPTLLQCEYILAVIAEISKSKKQRNILVLGDGRILKFVPVWILPLSLLQDTTALDWVSDLIQTIREQPKCIDVPSQCIIPQSLGHPEVREASNLSYFSDPNPLSSDEEETLAVCKPFRGRKKHLKQRMAVVKLSKKPCVGYKFILDCQYTDLTSVLQKWAWSMAVMANVVDQNANQDNYKINISTSQLQTVKKQVEFRVSPEDQQSTETCLCTSLFENFTKETQRHILHTERETMSSALVEVKSGSIYPGFKLQLPLRKLTPFMDGIDVTRSRNEEQWPMTWGWDTEISVPGDMGVKCELTVEERVSSWTFVSEFELSGTVGITVCDRNGKTVMFLEPNFARMLEGIEMGRSGTCCIKENVASFVNTGKVTVRYGGNKRFKCVEKNL